MQQKQLNHLLLQKVGGTCVFYDSDAWNYLRYRCNSPRLSQFTSAICLCLPSPCLFLLLPPLQHCNVNLQLIIKMALFVYLSKVLWVKLLCIYHTHLFVSCFCSLNPFLQSFIVSAFQSLIATAVINWRRHQLFHFFLLFAFVRAFEIEQILECNLFGLSVCVIMISPHHGGKRIHLGCCFTNLPFLPPLCSRLIRDYFPFHIRWYCYWSHCFCSFWLFQL